MPTVDNLNYLLVAVDAFSNYVMAVPMKNKSSHCIKIAIENLFNITGMPTKLYTDCEITLISALKELSKAYNLTIQTSTPYAHCQNIAESGIHTFKKGLNNFLNSSNTKSKWPATLTLVVE